MISIFRRTIKWRKTNWISVIVTLLQSMLWLVLYGNIAKVSFSKQGVYDYIAYITPGLLILVIFSAGSSGGMFNFIMKHENSWKRLMISPIKTYEIVIGQTLESSCCAVFEACILLLISVD